MKKYLKFVGIAVLIFIFLSLDIKKIGGILTQVQIPLLMLAFLLDLPMLFIKSSRWNLLLRGQKIHYSLWDTFVMYMSSLYIGFITPGRLGEFVKALYVKSDNKATGSYAFSSVLVDRLFDLYLLIILGLAGVWSFGLLGGLSSSSLVLIAIVVVAPLIVLNRKITGKLIQIVYKKMLRKKMQRLLDDTFNDFYDGLTALINWKLLISVFLTIASYALFFLQCYLILSALGVKLDYLTLTLSMAIANFISFAPISISGLGTRDATLIFLFAKFGLTSELALSYSMLVFLIFFVGGGSFGAIAWFMRPLPIDDWIPKGLFKRKKKDTDQA
ncbi:flippase-like domain-containing protein [bacterium]|nr:flippase-like domain-containing protein [bacterium]